ncbi:uncharacterized protein LOC131851748 [Achroia grisella]|uniref:uncharacterized protein LOC131851748 n=1 Tax=Achroia grisella TaxID=688607 RepID=UPI0027D2B117|nr:uncharacterized protein LOC131851748 [Achroia grisella]
MSNNRNKETQEDLKRKIKALQSKCVDTCNVIENSPLNTHLITPDNVSEKSLCYVEGLRSDIENSSTAIITDENLLTAQFLSEMTEKTTQIEDLTAYTKGLVHDVDAEINRLNELIKMSQAARSQPLVQKRQELRPEHLQKAKERFLLMKTEIHGLVRSLFPKHADLMLEVMAELMAEKLNENSNSYIPITAENYQIIELLKDINLVTTNPYNNIEVKIAY